MRRLFTNIGWLLGARAINAPLSLIYLALATRALGLEQFGLFAAILALGQTVTGLASFQTWQLIVRWGAGERDALPDPATLREVTGFAIALNLVSIAAGVVIAALLVATLPLWFALPGELVWPTFAFCVISLIATRTTPIGLLRVHFRYAAGTAAESVLPITRVLGALAAWVLMPNVTGFVIAFALAEIAVAAAYWYAATRVHRISFGAINLSRFPAQHADVWRFVWGTNLSSSLSTASKQVMLLLVGAIGGAAMLGGFRVASQLGQALIALSQTVSRALLPELVQARDDALAMTRRITIIAVIAGTLAVLVASLLGHWALELLAGEAFGAFYLVMVILALAGAVELVGASLESLLVAQGRALTAFAARAVPTALAFAALVPAIAAIGAAGAALSVLGASLVAVIGFSAAIRRNSPPSALT